MLDLIYENYTESNPAAPKTTVAGRAARARDKEFEAWLREIPGMDRLVEDCVGGKIPLWEEIMVRQGTATPGASMTTSWRHWRTSLKPPMDNRCWWRTGLSMTGSASSTIWKA